MPELSPAPVLLAALDPKLLEWIEPALRDIECRTVCASTGVEALEHLRGGEYALALLHSDLLPLGELEGARQTGTLAATFSAPVLLLSGGTTRGEMEHAFAIGCSDYILLPCHPKLLASKIAAWLAISKNRAEWQSRVVGLERDLQTSERRRYELLAFFATELRNPLAPILTAAQILAVAEPGTPRARYLNQILGRYTRRYGVVLDQLLGLAGFYFGQRKLQPERLDLAAVVRRAAAAAEEAAAPAEEAAEPGWITLDISLPVGAAWVQADPRWLEQAILILLKEALAGREPGKPAVLRLSLDHPRDRAVLDVSPVRISGLAAMLDTYFEPFVEERFRFGVGGDTLWFGPVYVKQLVKLHGGEVTVIRNETGALFRIFLPLDRSGASTANPHLMEPAPSRPLRILLIEKNEDVRFTVEEILRLDDHHVTGVSDLPGGFRAAEQFPPEVVVASLPPDADAAEVALRLRGHPPTSGAVLIAWLSPRPASSPPARPDGFDHSFTRPVPLEQFQELLATLARL